jgi:zinc transport system ATP-binding protein
MSLVSIHDVTFAYDTQPVLEHVSLEVNPHDFLAIIGPNGGGKSTLLKLILGIHPLQHGTIKVFGQSPATSLRDIGYVPQNTNVNTDFPVKVLDVVLMGNGAKHHPLFGYSSEEKACAMEALEQVGMEKYATRRIGSLSGGQRQRVMIARALCRRPKLLILDEPTASIDATGQKEIYDLLKKLNATITIIVVSHDLSVILGYANKAAHINRTLTYHDISDKRHIFHTHGATDDHFCEIDILEMLGGEACEVCHDCDDDHSTQGDRR